MHCKHTSDHTVALIFAGTAKVLGLCSGGTKAYVRNYHSFMKALYISVINNVFTIFTCGRKLLLPIGYIKWLINSLDSVGILKNNCSPFNCSEDNSWKNTSCSISAGSYHHSLDLL